MPTIPIDYHRVHTPPSVQHNSQAPATSCRPVLNNLDTVESSALNITTQQEMDNVRMMMQAGILTLSNEINSNKPLAEKLPVYINGGRKIRLATGAIERFYSVNPDVKKFSSHTGRDLLYTTLEHQLMMYKELQKALPPYIDNRLRLKIMDNIFSEQFADK